MEFKTGQIVEHKLSKDWLMVIEIGVSLIKCRTKDLRIVDLFDFEIQLPKSKS
jgi:hypothetical protein